MKKLLFALSIVALGLGMATAASAQTSGSSGEATGGQTKATAKKPPSMLDLLNKLNLSSRQRARLKEQVKKMQSSAKGIQSQVQSGKVTPVEAKSKLTELRKLNREAILQILNKDQRRDFLKAMKDARDRATDKTVDNGTVIKSGSGL